MFPPLLLGFVPRFKRKHCWPDNRHLKLYVKVTFSVESPASLTYSLAGECGYCIRGKCFVKRYFAARSETAATAAAESPAGKASATGKARTSRAARCGGHHVAGARGHVAQIVREHHRIKARTIRGAAIPLRRLRHDSLESPAPVFLHAERHRERQEFLEHFGRLNRAIETIGFNVHEKILKAKYTLQRARALFRVRRHEPTKPANDQAREDSRDDERQRSHALARSDLQPPKCQKKADDHARCD